MSSSSSGSTGERSSSSPPPPHNKIPENIVILDDNSDKEDVSNTNKSLPTPVEPPVAAVRSLDSRSFWKAGELEDARVHPKFLFLHSNATSHKWAFGAIAELFDNAVDEDQDQVKLQEQDQVKLQEQDQVKLQKQVDTIKKECRGFPLMEVFNIIYLSRDEVKPEKQHGTIKLICESGFQYLYNVPDVGVDTASKPSVSYKDDIPVTLKGPTSFGDALLKFDLFSGAYKGTMELRWYHEMLFRTPVFFEEIRIQSRDGTGEIVVHTGQFAKATVASLEVKLLNNVAATDVYGVVVASNSKLDRANCTSVLFVKKEDYKIQVGPDGIIPLSKSCIAVPLDSVLSVDFSLHVNGQCYTATVPFNAGNTGEVEGNNSENDPMIRVKVNWADASRDTRNKFYDRLCPTDFSIIL